MPTDTRIDRLIAASHRALGGTNVRDPWRAWDLTLEDSAVFVSAWADELAEKARDLGEDPDGRAFVSRCALGSLAVGAEYGSSRQRELLHEGVNNDPNDQGEDQ